MRYAFVCASLIAAASAAEPWLDEPDTGLEAYLSEIGWVEGEQPDLKDMRGIPDFQFAARQALSNEDYSFYRTGAAGEWAYRNNLDVWAKAKFRPHQLTGVTTINETMQTTILGYNFSAPFFIAPAARAGYGHPDGEINFVEAAAEQDILYMAALYASKTIEEIGAAKSNNTMNGPQVTFQQIYTNADLEVTWEQIRLAEEYNAKAIVWTIDAPATGTRHRAARYDTTNANSATSELTWDLYDEIKAHTNLPVIPKGITCYEDALTAIEKGAPAIFISNHGGRQVDHSPSPLEIAVEIYLNAPEVFEKVDVLADSGIRYGSDVLKLLALGVKAVGLGRPFMYANTYGKEGVLHMMDILKTEIHADAAQIGVQDIQNIPAKLLNIRKLASEAWINE